MFVLSATVLLAACLQVIFAQEFPPECRGPPKDVSVRPFECCKIPSFFDPEDFEKCGFKKPEDEGGPPPPHRHGPPDCSKQLCILEKYSLTKGEDIDHDAVSAFMDKFAEKNPDWKAAIEVAKERCVGKDLPGPPHICQANRQVFCLTATLLGECPSWDNDTEGCQALKEHMVHCKPQFEKRT